jgi:hypothetical protein
MFIYFTKTENRKAKQVQSGGLLSIRGRREDIRKRCRRVNMLEILITHVYK